jgi:membrane-bound lytic murein transglycosylase D
MEARLASIDTRMPMNFNTRVKAFIDYFTVKDRDYTRMVMARSTYFFPIFEEALARHQLPDELKYLSIVESGLSTRAYSRAAAVGLWQFVYATGRMYGLHADGFLDERMDPYKATEAACMFLKSLHNQFGDWELALAAYNCGPGNVRKAIRRSGYKKTFWEIYNYLPRETRGYVPQFVAVTYTFKYAEEHNFYLEDHEYQYAMAHDTVMVQDYVSLQTICDYLNVCIEDMEMLNPSIKNKALPKSTRKYQLRVPSDTYASFTSNRLAILDSAARSARYHFDHVVTNTAGNTYGRDKVIYRVRSGDVLGSIAGQFHVGVTDIKRWNNLHSNMIRVGQKLDIWLTPNVAKNYNSQPSSPKSVTINGTKYHVVQPGDTLWDIAKIYQNMTIDKLKKLNNLSNNNIKPGQKLVIG